ncbi:MAG: hypothetical protein L0214_13170, partial [candidate division NC10 bacterium]|nr:hypothetical protein [candidate division NC10 bacterium]
SRWYWVRPAGSPLRLTPISPKARLLASNGIPMAAGDQGRIADEPGLTLRATADVELILLDLP